MIIMIDYILPSVTLFHPGGLHLIFVLLTMLCSSSRRAKQRDPTKSWHPQKALPMPRRAKQLGPRKHSRPVTPVLVLGCDSGKAPWSGSL